MLLMNSLAQPARIGLLLQVLRLSLMEFRASGVKVMVFMGAMTVDSSFLTGILSGRIASERQFTSRRIGIASGWML